MVTLDKKWNTFYRHYASNLVWCMALQGIRGGGRGEMTVKLCDADRKSLAITLSFETDATQIDSASGKTEYLDDYIDLGHQSAITLLEQIIAEAHKRGGSDARAWIHGLILAHKSRHSDKPASSHFY